MYDARSAVDGRKWQDGGVITYVIPVVELKVVFPYLIILQT